MRHLALVLSVSGALLVCSAEIAAASASEVFAQSVDGITDSSTERLFVVLGGQCRVDGATPRTDIGTRPHARVLSELVRGIEPLVSTAVPEETRVLYARYLTARDVWARGDEQRQSSRALLEQLASTQVPGLTPVLEDLEARIRWIQAMRDARAELARIEFGAGRQPVLSINTSSHPNPSQRIVQALFSEFEKARREGLNCMRSEVFQFYERRSELPLVATAPPLRHRDLIDLQARADRLLAAIGALSVDADAVATSPPKIRTIVALHQEVQAWHSKALGVLGDAMALYREHLEQYPALPMNDQLWSARVAAVQEVADARRAQTPDQGAAGRDTAAQASNRGAIGSAPAARNAKQEAADSVARARDTERDSEGRSSGTFAAALRTDQGSADAGPGSAVVAQKEDQEVTDRREAHMVTGARRILVREGAAKEMARVEMRARIIDTVSTQVEAYRTPAGAGGQMVAPLGLANNLLHRAKQIFLMADMLELSDKANQEYSLSICRESIHITYEKSRSQLSRMSIVVDEKYEGVVLLSWMLAIKRKNDKNFTISAEFNGEKASITVKDGYVSRFPNHQQLLVLMNRLDRLADEALSTGGTLRTASR